MVGVLPRSDAHGAAEGTLQMLRAQSRGLSEAAKVGGSLRFCLDCLAHLPDRFHLRVDRCLLGVAAPARSVPCAFCILRRHEKKQILGIRVPRGARRPAINSRRAHGINEYPVLTCISRSHSPEEAAQ